MELNDTEKEQADKYVLDIKNTLISNTVYFMFAVLYGVFLVKAFDLIANMPDDQKVISLIVFMFAFIKITSGWSAYNIEYKTKGIIK